MQSIQTNNPFVSLFRRLSIKKFRVADAIYCNDKTGLRFELIRNNRVCFDFSDDKYVHLGDVLFYLPLILYFDSFTQVHLICGGIKASVLKYLLAKSNPKVHFADEVLDNSVVITSPYILQKYTNPNPRVKIVCGVGFAEKIPDLAYPLYLARSFISSLGAMDKYSDLCSSYNNFIQVFRATHPTALSSKNLPASANIVLFSPFISSGKFRDVFQLKFRKLIRIAKTLVYTGSTVCLVGGHNDPSIAGLGMVDLRGTDMGDLLDWARQPNVVHGLGFDNFWMHYFDLMDKPYQVMFRGRYSNRARAIHYTSINVAFCSRLPRTYL